MTRFETSWATSDLHIPFLDSIDERLAEFETDNIIRLKNRTCKVTQTGRTFLRNVCMAFDAHLATDAPGQKLFSRTI
jgi:oxygen-independent coproporphyrinogen-3 oxidase